MDRVIQQMNELMAAALASDDLFPSVAKMMSKMRDALIAEGVTREEAVEIVARQGASIKTG